MFFGHCLRKLFRFFFECVWMCIDLFEREEEKTFERWMIFEKRGKTYSWIARYRLHSNFVYVQLFKGKKHRKRGKKIKNENSFSSKHTYRSSKNINFNSMLARNINIFKFNLISVIDDDGNEWPTATNPKFCTQLWPSPYPLSIWNTRAFK